MPNVLANPRSWTKKAVLVKLESTVGTDAVPTGTADWVEARNLEITPYEAETVERNIEMPYYGHGGTLPTGKYVSVQFQVAMVGSGTAGDVPKISPLIRACGFAETVNDDDDPASVVYSPLSENIPAVTIYVGIDGVRHKLVGARGTLTLTMSAQQIPLFQFNFQAVYEGPDAAAQPVVNKAGWQVEQPVGSATTTGVTIGGAQLAYSEFSADLANEIARLDLPGPQREISITNRAPTGSITVLAPGLDVFNPFALVNAGSTLALRTTQDNRDGYKVQVDGKVRLTGLGYAQIDNQVAYTLNLEFTPVAGNDEMTFTYL
jgi:hypothetical protein